MIFQDPISSLNPRRRVGDIVAEPLNIWKIGTKEERKQSASAMLDQVGIDPYLLGGRRPREFSGGQCQRISIARALVLKPKLLVCDEVVSALDVSVQAQILNLLEDLKQEYNLTILFIAHDLAVVKNVSDRVAVMYLGRLCEIAPSDLLYEAPAHHYTAALLASAVEPDPETAGHRPRCSGNRRARSTRRRDAVSGHAARGRTPLRRGGPRDAGDRARPPGGLPLPHRELRADPARPRPSVLFASSPQFPDRHDDWPLERAALERVGIDARTAVWSDPGVEWSACDLVVANGAWDNIHHAEAFMTWLATSPTRACRW